ncbi:ArdC family protein [Sphingomonas sp. GlSt437]|uniref:ArdC family protein n=1 Tax=Sphingomonas sp. GlSt437 TaxID=3389970 RepID=UPI003A8A793B
MPRPASRGARSKGAGDNRQTENRANLYDEVTARIIAELEAGRFPWVQPWSAVPGAGPCLPRNALTGRNYSGVNVLILWGAVIEQGFPSQSWLTFRQAQEAGGCVRKGERGQTVVYADRFVPQAEKAKAEASGEDAKPVPFLKRFTVFNVAQCEGLGERLASGAAPLPEREIVPVAEEIIAASGVDFRIGGSEAFYVPSLDFVSVPPQPAFFDQINYYRTCLHEVGNIASVLVAGGAGEGAVERYLRHLHCGEQSPGGGRLDARTAAGAATQRCGVIGIAAGASGIRRRLPASRSSAVLAR